MPIDSDCTFPSEAERQKVFNRVAKENPNKEVKFMHGPFNRASISRKGDFMINEYKDNRNDHPKGTGFIYTDGVGFALEPKKSMG